MGVASSTLTPDESAALLSISSHTHTAYEDEKWMAVFRYKVPLDALSASSLHSQLREATDRMVRNNPTSRNLVTLAAHVTARLPRVWYFSATDVELTVNAVVLLRTYVHTLIADAFARAGSARGGVEAGGASLGDGADLAATSDAAAAIVAQLATGREDSAGGGPGATSHAGGAAGTGKVLVRSEIAEFSLQLLVDRALDFLATAPVTPALYELHTQVLTLLVVLFSTQLMHEDVATAATLVAAATQSSLHSLGDPFLVAAMVAGRGTVSHISAASTDAKGTSRARAVISCLLRNVGVDGSRIDDAVEPSASENSSASAASLAVAAQRGKAIAALSTATNTGVPTPGSSSRVVAAADAVVSTVASAATKLTGLPVALVSALVSSEREPVARTLAERSALLLLLLVNAVRSGVEADVAKVANPYRAALAEVVDAANPLLAAAALPASGSPAAGEPPAPPSPPSVPLPVNFRSLFTALVHLSDAPLGTMLLYSMMYTAPAFADYVLTRSDVDELLLPLLQQLYTISALGPDHRYILLITLLLFTQDAAFCVNAHRRIMLSKIPWFKDRILGKISLGSFMAVLLARVLITAGPPTTVGAGAAAAYSSDSYLHTNCLATIANMGPYMEGLHPYAAQRMLHALSSLVRRYKRVATRIHSLDEAGDSSTRDASTNLPTSASHESLNEEGGGSAREQTVETLHVLLEHYDQCIRILVDVLLAACAPSVLPSNTALLYAMLHDRNAIDALAGEPAFTEQVAGLQDILGYFATVLRGEGAKRAAAHAATGSGGPGSTATRAAAEQTPNAGATAPNSAGASLGSPVALASSNCLWEEQDVMDVLATAARSWRGGQAAAAAAASLTETKFTYVEDSAPELFFVPYIWGLTIRYTTDVGWEMPHLGAPIRLLSPPAAPLYVIPGGASAVSAHAGSSA